jgi:hypothetical protein
MKIGGQPAFGFDLAVSAVANRITGFGETANALFISGYGKIVQAMAFQFLFQMLVFQLR